ncbi:hypothetical protein NW759_014458 [Fusarium solani]|nr:hypothetical protein NW759_014458 [Fusarium solani]
MAKQPSTLSQVLPLLIVFALLGVGGWVGYQVYISVAKMQDAASERMGKKNVVFTKDGVKVGVKQIKTENYVDATQSWVVKAWNLGTTGKDDQRSKSEGPSFYTTYTISADDANIPDENHGISLQHSNDGDSMNVKEQFRQSNLSDIRARD